MKDGIFISWGANRELADEVAAQLRSELGRTVYVGGIGDVRSVSDIYFGPRIMSQMDTCSHAIILLQYAPPDPATKTFRPNIFMEWGYLLRSLRPEAIHPFLINAKRDALPSNLIGSNVPEITANDLRDPAERAALARDICARFRAEFLEEDFDGFSAFSRYDEIFSDLRARALDPGPLNERYVENALLHLVQPTFYRQERASLEFIVRVLGNKLDRMTEVTDLLGRIESFYDVTDRIAADGAEQAIRKDPAKLAKYHRDLSVIARNFSRLAKNSGERTAIFQVLAHNFAGLSELRKCYLIFEAGDIDASIANLSQAVAACDAFGKHETTKALWLGYAKRNLSRAFQAKARHLEQDHGGDPASMKTAATLRQDAEKALEEASEYRRQSRQRLATHGATYFSTQLDAEISLTDLDRLRAIGSSEEELLLFASECAQKFPAPSTIWLKLMVAIADESRLRGYERVLDLTARLLDKEPYPG
ncbi:hypothetical protein [Rhizorhabdus dicambivorans]|uniref:TIR domain-containing protein n=1 Tax=Rhizorhabdus dicambivorans TaxID=1850238 RepID=A0A2A4G0C7_9SPHN|nr:hypothetical protein [Rhizorhabdus dicambivorans]ATE63241.1 hypothetical protein CMV14_01535 [Rhizorhabdus dicambivorans]PCE43453.1 hypothetical protein COO09_03855 [Rhizorhabdus dicambivorans]